MRKHYRTIAGPSYAPLLFLFAIACHDDKPIVTADPDFANCAGEKDKRENDCLIDSGKRADFDACIARVRKSCVDGGVK